MPQFPLLKKALLHHRSYSGVQNHSAVYVQRPPLRSALRAPTASVDPAVYMPPPLRHGAVGCAEARAEGATGYLFVDGYLGGRAG